MIPTARRIFAKAADYIHRVVSGAVRTYKVLADGRRQVGGFYLLGAAASAMT
jgi:hypothetical protein